MIENKQVNDKKQLLALAYNHKLHGVVWCYPNRGLPGEKVVAVIDASITEGHIVEDE